MKNIIVENIEEYREALENVEELTENGLTEPIEVLISKVEQFLTFPVIVTKNWAYNAKDLSITLPFIKNSVNWNEIREQYIKPWYKKEENIGKLYYFWDKNKENGIVSIFTGYDNCRAAFPEFHAQCGTWENAEAIKNTIEIGTTE